MIMFDKLLTSLNASYQCEVLLSSYEPLPIYLIRYL